MKKTKNKLLISLVFSLICFVLSAQENLTYTGNLKNDTLIGFKKIILTPELRAVANDDFSDLRVFDTQMQQTPYFIQNFSYKKTGIVFFSINNKIYNTKKETKIVIDNPQKNIYNLFTFKVSNASVRKNCKIEGSNDSKKWYVISEKIYLNLSKNTAKGFNYYNINFPSIDYKYIRLVINDSLSAPIHIKDVGYFEHKKTSNELKYQSLDYTYKILQKEKLTLIHVTANKTFEINRLKLIIDNPNLYSRNARLYYAESINNEVIKHPLKSIHLNSKSPNSFKNLTIKQKEFWIEVDNKDDQPLSIVGIDFYQQEKYLVIDLKPNQNYTIVAGDKKLKKPSYDLVNFMHEIEYDLPIVKIEGVKTTKQELNIFVKEKKFYEKSWFMWLSMGAVGIIILLFTLSLLKKTEEL